MKIMRRIAAICLCIALLAAGSVYAEQGAASAQSQNQQAIDPQAYAIAKEMVKSLDMSSTLQGIFAVMSKTLMPLIMRDNPNQSQAIQIIAANAVQKTFMEHMPELEENKAIVYAQMYSVDELKQLNKFYQSPVGKKMMKTMPEMMQKSMVLDQGVIFKAMDEAKRAIANELRNRGMTVPQEMGL